MAARKKFHVLDPRWDGAVAKVEEGREPELLIFILSRHMERILDYILYR